MIIDVNQKYYKTNSNCIMEKKKLFVYILLLFLSWKIRKEKENQEIMQQ